MKSIACALAGASLAISFPAGAAPAAAAPAQAPAADAAALDPVSLDLAHQIVTIAFPPEKRSEMYASVMESIMGQTRKQVESQLATGDTDFDAIVDHSMQEMYKQMQTIINASIPDYFNAFERAYARDFSRDDLQAILAFVKTPVGKRYFARAPDLLKDSDVQAANARMTKQLLAKLPELQQHTMQEIKDYVAKKKQQESADPAQVS